MKLFYDDEYIQATLINTVGIAIDLYNLQRKNNTNINLTMTFLTHAQTLI